jgi:hypothetical protein
MEVGMVYGLRRRRTTRSQLMKSELGESFDHLRQAAAHAAGGIGATVAPRVSAAGGYMKPARMRKAASSGWDSTVAAFAPIAAAAKDGALEAGQMRAQQIGQMKAKQMRRLKKQMGKSRRRRWPMLASLLAVGAAVGAAGAMVTRRRRRRQWEEYDPSHALSTVGETADSVKSSVGSTMGKVSETATAGGQMAKDTASMAADRVSSMAEKASDKVSSTADKASGKVSSAAESATETVKRQTDQAADKTEDLISRGGAPSKNTGS